MALPVRREKRFHAPEEKLEEPQSRLTKKTHTAAVAAIAPSLHPGRRSFQQLETASSPLLLPHFARPPKRVLTIAKPSAGFSSAPSSAFRSIKLLRPTEPEDEELIRLLSRSSITPYPIDNRCISPTPDLEQSSGTDMPAQPQSPRTLAPILQRSPSETPPPHSGEPQPTQFSPIRPSGGAD